MVDVGKRLKQLRHPLTQAEFARLLGVDRSTLASWEVGRREPDIERLAKIADLFQVSLDWLAGRETLPTLVPLADSSHIINLATELAADFAIRLEQDVFPLGGLKAGDIAFFRRSQHAQVGQFVALADTSPQVAIYTNEEQRPILGTLVYILKQPANLTPAALAKLRLQQDPYWQKVITYATERHIRPAQIHQLLLSAVRIHE